MFEIAISMKILEVPPVTRAVTTCDAPSHTDEEPAPKPDKLEPCPVCGRMVICPEPFCMECAGRLPVELQALAYQGKYKHPKAWLLSEMGSNWKS